MPMRTLVNIMDPPPPGRVVDAANRLQYRDFLTVVLIVDKESIFPDNWIYVHAPNVRVARIQNFKNWSPEMVPDPAKTSLGLEYFVNEGDTLWTSSDEDLIAMARRECASLGLIREEHVTDGAVVRAPKAYPVYDARYKAALISVLAWCGHVSNLVLVGRNGLHRYNNQDHSMLTGVRAARRICGEAWDAERGIGREYLEEAKVQPVLPDVLTEEMVRDVFARYDALALGVSLGSVAGLALAVPTIIQLVKHRDSSSSLLSLLDNYLIGFELTWLGVLIGMVEMFAVGFLYGYVLAKAINLLVGWHETTFRRELDMARTLV
jgi:hypothetical protein